MAAYYRRLAGHCWPSEFPNGPLRLSCPSGDPTISVMCEIRHERIKTSARILDSFKLCIKNENILIMMPNEFTNA